MVQILDGQHQAKLLTSKLKNQVTYLHSKGIYPSLAAVLVGDNPASHLYVKKKQEKAAELGIQTQLFHLPSTISQEQLHHQLISLNEDSSVHGILLQLPLPPSLNTLKALKILAPEKDVDGLTPLNVGLFSLNEPLFIPCTPQGCLHLIHLWKKELQGLEAVILGRSSLVGSPIARLLLQENCTVTIAHSHTQQIDKVCKRADILIVAIGKKNFVQGSWIKPGACVIDVGINPLEDKQITGDVDTESAAKVAGAISPVPGGVGPLTIMFLMANILKAAQQQEGATL